MTETLDARCHPWRADLAAAHLEGRVAADRFVEGSAMRVADAAAPLLEEPRGDARLASEALFGETVTVYERAGDWAWGQVETDGYVGYLPATSLGGPATPVTHRVAALRTPLFPHPDIKSRPAPLLSLNARLAVDRVEGDFAVLADGAGHVVAGHVVAADEVEPDFVAVAERFLGTPYLWGGRQSLGIDCSGLVQMALAAAGIACPRDSDMQQALGTALDPAASDGLRRGDLVFWPGHVAIMTDDRHMIHANAHHMQTVIEEFAPAAARIADAAGPVVAIRRIAA